MDSLTHIVYASAASADVGEREVFDILASARRNNARLDITGMLLFDARSFFQVLEGDAPVLDLLYQTIVGDKRHKQITKIIQEPIAKRHFGDWSMAFSGVSQHQLDEIDGLNDFFSRGRSFHEIDAGRAKKLLDAFAKGRWRKALD